MKMKKKLLYLLLGISAISTAQITTSTQYTPIQLVNNVLLGNTTITATNITSSSGVNFGSVNSLGYFTQNGSSFPFSEGIILSTGDIISAPGPNTSAQSVGSWPGDASLQAILDDNGMGGSSDATSLSFTFVAPSDHMTLDLIFASEEYGLYQCNYGDAFAIFLTHVSSGNTINIGTLPNTVIPVSVTTVRNSQYNSSCASANEEYFGNYYPASDTSASVNFNGITVPITADGDLIPGATYNIKFVIADRNDSSYDSALFINSINFDVTPPVEIAVPDDLVICDTDTNGMATFNLTSITPVVLDGLNPSEYNVTYHETYLNAQNGQNAISNPSQFINQSPFTQTIYVRVTKIENPANFATAFFSIIVQPAQLAGTVETVVIMDDNNDAVAYVDLTSVDGEILNGLPEGQYSIEFFTSESNASAGAPRIVHPNTYAAIQIETIYFRLENELTGCYTVGSFEVVVLPSDYETPAPEGASEQEFTPGETLGDIQVDGENIQWYSSQNPIAGRSGLTDDTPLPLSTLLVDNTTYYASQTINGIESIERLPVTVHAALGTADNAFSGFSIYPNPVKDVLIISNNEPVGRVILYNLLGQAVYDQAHAATQAQLNLSSFVNGVYLVKVITGEYERTIKIVKQ